MKLIEEKVRAHDHDHPRMPTLARNLAVGSLLLCAPSMGFSITSPSSLLHRRHAAASSRAAMMVDSETLQAVAIYDSLAEGKLAMAMDAKEAAEALAADLKKELATKSEEVEKFAKSVEDQLKESAEEAKEAKAKMATLTNELKESNEQLAMVNTHLEAHTAASTKLRAELDEAKAEAKAAKAEAEEAKAALAKAKKDAKAAAAKA